MSHYCQRCDKEFGFGDTLNDVEGLTFCTECFNWIEEHEKVDGRLKIEKCKCCKRIVSWDWVPYKKRGRKMGGHNKPKPPISRSIFEFKKKRSKKT